MRKNDKNCFIQSLLHRLLNIFPIFRAICEYHAPLLQIIHRTIFSHLRTNQSATQQTMQTRGNRKEPSLVSKPHGVELPRWVLPTCREPILPDVVEHSHEKMTLCCLIQYSGLFASRERFESLNYCWPIWLIYSLWSHQTHSFWQSDSVLRSM